MTGSFRDACVDMDIRMRRLRSHDLLSRPPLVAIVAQKIGADDDVAAPDRNPATMNQLAGALLAAIHAGATLKSRKLRDAIWCMWSTKPALAEDPLALATILDAVSNSDKRKPFRNLAAVYLVQFLPDRPGLQLVSTTLQRCAPKWGKPWSEHHHLYALYDPVKGPRNISAKALREGISPTEAMQSIGLRALDAQSGFAEEITRNFLVELANGAEPDHRERLEKVRAYTLDARGELLFKTLDLEVAEALLKPFIGKTPEKVLKDLFLNFVVSIFRDPRMYPARWERFPHIKSLVISWLTEQSLRQFLDIVGQTIDTTSDAEMWKYRRAFWEAAHRKGIIKGAWVVFGDDGALLARRSFGNNAGFGVFSGQGGKQIQRTHAVLLLEIGSGVVADWSHNGKVNIWTDATERGAPLLYRKMYSSDDVSISSGRYDEDNARHLVKTHHAPKSYNWQRVVADRIYRMTNTRLNDSDYRA